MDIGFAAVETFTPTQSYIDWSKLHQVREIVSIDSALNPRIIEYSEDERPYLIWIGDYWCYKSLDRLLERVRGKKDIHVLALTRNPETDCASFFTDKNIDFMGYDLIEDAGISALTNCGGFDRAFLNSDISVYGLIKDFAKAKEIKQNLLTEYPDESHADCSLWAIWRIVR